MWCINLLLRDLAVTYLSFRLIRTLLLFIDIIRRVYYFIFVFDWYLQLWFRHARDVLFTIHFNDALVISVKSQLLFYFYRSFFFNCITLLFLIVGRGDQITKFGKKNPQVDLIIIREWTKNPPLPYFQKSCSFSPPHLVHFIQLPPILLFPPLLPTIRHARVLNKTKLFVFGRVSYLFKKIRYFFLS